MPAPCDARAAGARCRAPKWKQIQSQRFATQQKKTPRQVGGIAIWCLPEMSEPMPADEEAATVAIEVCVNGLFMGEAIKDFDINKSL